MRKLLLLCIFSLACSATDPEPLPPSECDGAPAATSCIRSDPSVARVFTCDGDIETMTPGCTCAGAGDGEWYWDCRR